MSYEGYSQNLCVNGHYWTQDCYDYDDKHCPICRASRAWYNNVDTTNGSFCNLVGLGDNPCDGCDGADCDSGRIDGYVELEMEKEAIYKNCPTCGHFKLIEEPTFKIPTDKGHKITEGDSNNG